MGMPTVHPPPTLGAPTAQLGVSSTLGCTPLSSWVPALGTQMGSGSPPGFVGLGRSHPTPGLWGPHSPAASPRALWGARCVPARRQLSALGTSLPGICCNEPSLPKLLRAAEMVPGKANARARPPPPGWDPPTSNTEPHPGSEPLPSPSSVLSLPHHPQPIHPMVTGGTWHLMPGGSSIPTAGPSARV